VQSATTSQPSLDKKSTSDDNALELPPELHEERLKEVKAELQYLSQVPKDYQLSPAELDLVRKLQRSAMSELLLRLKGKSSRGQTNQQDQPKQDSSTKPETSDLTI
jgi:hypothetical protein